MLIDQFVVVMELRMESDIRCAAVFKRFYVLSMQAAGASTGVDFGVAGDAKLWQFQCFNVSKNCFQRLILVIFNGVLSDIGICYSG